MGGMKLRTLKCLRWALALTFCATSSAAAAQKAPRTIVLVLIDALRHDHMGVYGYSKPTTPNLDAFAARGTRYTRMYANAPWTRPSTVSFLTGYSASRHRTESARTRLPGSVVTLAQRLKKMGYTTAGFTANGNGGSLAGLEKGFDVFEDPTRSYPRAQRGPTYCCGGLPTGPFLVQRVAKWLETDRSARRFIFVFFVDPHDPYGAPPDLESMFLGKGFTGEPKRNSSWEYNNNYSAEERRQLVALYDAGIRYSDQAFAQLLEVLAAHKLDKDATVFVSADHGEGFGEHNFYKHAHHFWEEVIHVPLLAVGPRFTPGAVDTRLTQSIDVTRTVAQLAGASTQGLEGRSLLEPAVADAHVISEYNEFGIHRQAIVGPQYKVIWQRPADEARYMADAREKKYFPSVLFDRERVRVFDLSKDPGERADLTAAPPTPAADLLKTLRTFVADSPPPQPP